MKQAITLGLVAYLLSLNVHAADDWQFLLAPYMWFAGAKGDLTTAPDTAATSIDVSALEALRDTDASFMLLFEAKKRRHGVLLDVFYSDVLQDSQTSAAFGLAYKASLKNTMVTTGYTYEIYGSPHAIISVVGGLRYWKVDTRLTLGSGSPQRFSVNNSETWVDPIVGADVKFRPSNSPVCLSGFLGVGGATGGSDSFYDVSGHISYQLTNSMVASIGYRLFDVDYEDDSFIYDIKQQGWVIGLVWILGTPRLSAAN